MPRFVSVLSELQNTHNNNNNNIVKPEAEETDKESAEYRLVPYEMRHNPAYLSSSTNQFYYGHQMAGTGPTNQMPSYSQLHQSEASEEFQDGDDESNEVITADCGQEVPQELGHYGRGIENQAGAIRGYTGRSDAFVWRPY